MKNITMVTAVAAVLCTQAIHAEVALAPAEFLGKKLYKDANLSFNRNQSCESCHTLAPKSIEVGDKERQKTASFVDPINVTQGTPVSEGSIAGEFGGLNAPSSGYAAFSPEFHYDATEDLYVGGQFWDGRESRLNGQAKGPFTNPVEMAMPNRASVIARLQEDPEYHEKFIEVFNIDLSAVSTDGSDPDGVENAYHAMSVAIEEFERSGVFNRFTSKFDFVETGMTEYTDAEQRGADVFDAVCANCHAGTGLDEAEENIVSVGLMTDFTYDNLGVPANADIPEGPVDGLGGNQTVIDDGRAGANRGKQKVMTLRNIAVTPPFMHNGVLPTLEMVVHFYNTRDHVDPDVIRNSVSAITRVCVDSNDPGMGVECWPEPEVADNVNTDELGNLGLSAEEEADLVAYLKTFTDGYDEWGKDPNVPKGSVAAYPEGSIVLPYASDDIVQ